MNISENEKNDMILHLVDELPVLRTKMGVSQDELANMLGISRQSYSLFETKKRKMPWSIFLSLLLVFDYNENTHLLIHKEGLLPDKIFKKSQDGEKEKTTLSFLTWDEEIRKNLDDKAIHAIETVIMFEYARCNNISGEAVIKAFDGKRLISISDKDVQVSRALKNIKANSSI